MTAKSKTKIENQLRKKNNSELVETIILAKKNSGWLEVAAILSGSRKNRKDANLSEISEKTKKGDKVVVPGKVLSQGDIDKKIKVIALNFSDKAKEKLSEAGCETSSLLEEIKSNPSAEGLKILGTKENKTEKGEK